MPHVPLLHVLCGVWCESGCEYMRISLFVVVIGRPRARGRACGARGACCVCGPGASPRVGLWRVGGGDTGKAY